jgi:hypothetical protein
VDFSDPAFWLQVLNDLMQSFAPRLRSSGNDRVVYLPGDPPPPIIINVDNNSANAPEPGGSMAYVMNAPIGQSVGWDYAGGGGLLAGSSIGSALGAGIGSLISAVMPGGAVVRTAARLAPYAVGAAGEAALRYMSGPSSSASSTAMRVQRTIPDSVALWRSELRACKRVQKIARLAHKASGTRRSYGRRRPR